MSKQMEGVKQYFKNADSKGTWASMERGTKGRSHGQLRQQLIREVKPKAKKCLDVGCGLGRFVNDYVSYGASLTVGVDLNLENLTRCKEIEDVFLVRADIERLPFQNDVFDVVSCIATMPHLPNPQKAMNELVTVTRKSGIVCVTWNHYNWLEALSSKYVRSRFRGALRDLLGQYLKPFRKQMFYRNKGFSTKEVISLNNELRLKSFFRFNIRGRGHLLVSIGEKSSAKKHINC